MTTLESCRTVECAACGRTLNRNASDTIYDDETGDYYGQSCYEELDKEIISVQCLVCREWFEEDEIDGSGLCCGCHEKNEDR